MSLLHSKHTLMTGKSPNAVHPKQIKTCYNNSNFYMSLYVLISLFYLYFKLSDGD